MSEIQSEIEIIASLYSENKNLIIFDIGAHTFDDGIAYKRIFPEVEVYSFEPHKKNLDLYTQYAHNFGVNVVPAAVSDTDGEIYFYPSDSRDGKPWDASGSTFKIKNELYDNYHNIKWGNEYLVQSVRFDTFCELNDIQNVDYIHMDVQGGEYNVMKSVGKYRPKYIFAETCEFDSYDTNTSFQEFNEYMLGMGYEVHTKFSGDTLYKYKN